MNINARNVATRLKNLYEVPQLSARLFVQIAGASLFENKSRFSAHIALGVAQPFQTPPAPQASEVSHNDPTVCQTDKQVVIRRQP